jgi:uncharacterized protein YoxC
MELNIAEFKNPQTITSATALAVSIGSILYMQKQINNIKFDLEELKGHFNAIITVMDPKSNEKIDQLIKAVKSMDAKICAHDQQLRSLGSESNIDRSEPTVKRYVRFTPKAKTNEVFTGINLKQPEVDTHLDADLRAMQD